MQDILDSTVVDSRKLKWLGKMESIGVMIYVRNN
jgi:hypothetical protein